MELRSESESLDASTQGGTKLEVDGGESARSEQPPPIMNGHPPVSSMAAAADLMREIDTACAEMNSLAVDAARDARQARKNARAASELARKYSSSDGRAAPPSHVVSDEGQGDQVRTENGPFFFLETKDGRSSSAFAASSGKNGAWMNGAHHTGELTQISPPMSSSLKDTTTPPSPSRSSSSSPKRLSWSHAEEVLSTSLELERCKQALEQEQMSHDETKTALSRERTKTAELQAQLEELHAERSHQQPVDSSDSAPEQHEVMLARMQVEAANQDAQMALDLAATNAERYEQVETWLEQALTENEMLRTQLTSATSTINHEKEEKPKHSVHFADAPTILTGTPEAEKESSPSRCTTPRSLVIAGRNVLQRSTATLTENRPGEDGDEELPSSFMLYSPSRSADRRKRLRDRLKNLGVEDVHIATPSSLENSILSPDRLPDSSSAHEDLDVIRNVARTLKQSGERLHLTGRWWRQPDGIDDQSSPGSADGSPHLEAMARHYCTSVEVRMMLPFPWMLGSDAERLLVIVHSLL